MTRAETFIVQNPTTTWCELTMKDAALMDIGATGGKEPEHSIDFTTPGDEEVVFSLVRGSQDVDDFAIFWRSPV